MSPPHSATSKTPERVLLVGGANFDSVVDSYRRALAAHHHVRVFDPFVPFDALGGRFGLPVTRRLTAALSLASTVVKGDPLALVEPKLARVAEEFRPDLVLVTAIEGLRPSAVRSLRAGNADCKVIGVYSDHLANFGRGYFFAADYDALFFKDRFIVDRLRRKLGWTHAHYLPQACDRSLHRPLPLSSKDVEDFGCDLTLAGSLYMYRAEMLNPLVGRDLKIWGLPASTWMQQPITKHCTGRWVAGDDKCRAMLAAKIVLNQNHYAEIAGTNKRTFEVAAIGAFQITDTPALGDVFEPGVEVANFDTQAEMLEMVDHYLARPEERMAMAGRAQRRAHAQHTYEHRWVAQLAVVGRSPDPSFCVQPESNQVWAQ